MSTRRARIVVLDDSERALRRLADWRGVDKLADVVIHHDRLIGTALIDALKDADVVVLMRDRTPFTAELLSQLPHLRYLVFTGTRNTKLDLGALAARHIPVSCTEFGPSKDSTCELTWTLILEATKQLSGHVARLQAGGWRPEVAAPLPGTLVGQRLGLIGLGEIGARVARVGKAFGMDVVTWSPHMNAERAASQGVSFLPLDELLATSRVVSLHLVVAATTRHLINAERLSLMRPDALLVNTSRAELIDTPALVQALSSGHLGGVALDVFDTEPLALTDPLRRLPNALLSPHLGFVAEQVFQRFAEGVVECLQAWLGEKSLVRVVTPER